MFSRLFLILILVSLAATGGWFAGQRRVPESSARGPLERRVLFYQSPMHPWIKSDKPGNCTICGMKLVPVYDGETGINSVSPDQVKLNADTINVLHPVTVPVVQRPLRRALHVAGIIEDNDATHKRLSATVEGRIEKLFVNSVGAEVTAGQPLLAFFSRELLVARGEYAQALRQPPSSEREPGIASVRSKLRRMGLLPQQIDSLATQTGDTIEVLAPISGTVVERKVYEGQYVKEGDVLFEIADFSKMWFVAEVYERDLAWVKVGQMVEVSTPTVPGKIFTAPIAFIDPNLVTDTRTARIRVVIENPHVGDPARHRHELLHNVYADGYINIETPETLLVPRSAILNSGHEATAYVDKGGGVFEPRTVALGRAGDEDFEVISGLSEGDSVVTNGNLLIDAQAQLNRGASEPEVVPVTVDAPMTDAQRTSAEALLNVADALAGRLAADDLAGFNEQAAQISAAARAADARLATVANLTKANDLAMARKSFQPLGEALAAWADSLRKKESMFSGIKIYRCPMTSDAFPGAPAKAAWVQLVAPIRNPYFGRLMPDCGEEVKP